MARLESDQVRQRRFESSQIGGLQGLHGAWGSARGGLADCAARTGRKVLIIGSRPSSLLNNSRCRIPPIPILRPLLPLAILRKLPRLLGMPPLRELTVFPVFRHFESLKAKMPANICRRAVLRPSASVSCRLGWLLAGVVVAFAGPSAFGQAPVLSPERLPEVSTVDARVRPATSLDEDDARSADSDGQGGRGRRTDDATLDELVRRLRATEERLAAMESARAGGGASGLGSAETSLGGISGLGGDRGVSDGGVGASTVGDGGEFIHAGRLDVLDSMDVMQDPPKPKKWFEKYTVRGYAQFRFNSIIDEEDGSAPAMHNGDSSVGANQTFLIRRARLIFQGDMSERVSFYLQPDFASTPNGSVDAIQFTQIRDWYADIHLDKTKIHRFRVGQSKVPYGWENMQSSSNRLPLDRNDAFNSAVKNERDLGVFYYWTPEFAQETFKYIQDEGLKGSGNYGVFGVGAYAGQGGSFREQNDSLHVVTRLTLPITFSNGQIVEMGVQGYTGMYTVLSSAISPRGIGPAVRPLGTLETGDADGIVDKRVGGTFVYYPQPFGFQAEWNVGRGPGLNDAQNAVVDRPLYGGYVQSMYRIQTDCHGEIWPFIRWNYYKGGYKSERNAPFVEIDELEVGVEWQIGKYVELVGMYTLTDRTNTRALSTANTLSYEQFEGQLARFQVQVNY